MRRVQGKLPERGEGISLLWEGNRGSFQRGERVSLFMRRDQGKLPGRGEGISFLWEGTWESTREALGYWVVLGIHGKLFFMKLLATEMYKNIQYYCIFDRLGWTLSVVCYNNKNFAATRIKSFIFSVLQPSAILYLFLSFCNSFFSVTPPHHPSPPLYPLPSSALA